MSLMGHLKELRTRILRCVIAVFVLGVASLVYSKEIFGLLMRPVLNALPASGRSLIYTSGIEEINVLMKVGLYCGLFLTTPVILWQLWAFVAPGLYLKERKLATPFVLFGSLAFLGGALFCYFGVLPTMFQYLLNDEKATAISSRLETGRLHEQEALRFFRNGEIARAGEIAHSALQEMGADSEGRIESQGIPSNLDGEELLERLGGFGRLLDSTPATAASSSRPALRQILELRLSALDAYSKGDLGKASQTLEQGAVVFAGIYPSQAVAVGELWKLEKGLSTGKVAYEGKAWTRPMLTMREQLSLVLLLELAFGVIFELPLVMALLALVGLVKASFLIKYQRHAIVVCLIAAAVITPTGDAVNLALMTVPMLLCYELGVLAAWLIEKRRTKEAASSALTPST